MSYLFDGKTYDNYDPAFMASLGMSEDAIASVLAQRDYELGEGVRALRQHAYEAESDPLFMEWQFDKTAATEKAWRDKVAEIKARYPMLAP